MTRCFGLSEAVQYNCISDFMPPDASFHELVLLPRIGYRDSDFGAFTIHKEDNEVSLRPSLLYMVRFSLIPKMILSNQFGYTPCYILIRVCTTWYYFMLRHGNFPHSHVNQLTSRLLGFIVRSFLPWKEQENPRKRTVMECFVSHFWGITTSKVTEIH